MCDCALRTALALAIQGTAVADTEGFEVPDGCRKSPLYTVTGILVVVVAAFAFVYFDRCMKVHTHKPVIVFV